MEAYDPIPSGKIGAVVVAAGNSQRMSGLDKIFFPLLGRPLVSYVLDTLEVVSEVSEVVLVVAQENLDDSERLVRRGPWKKIGAVCVGGFRRQDSVAAGLASLDHVDWVVVHDGARPCVTASLVRRGLAAAAKTGAAVPGIPPSDTIKMINSRYEVVKTTDRSCFSLVQTPQVFRADLLRRAHANILDEVTDDAAMIESLEIRVQVFPGSQHNIKVTVPEDIAIAEAILLSQGHRSLLEDSS